jgi:hypothetical protein
VIAALRDTAARGTRMTPDANWKLPAGGSLIGRSEKLFGSWVDR